MLDNFFRGEVPSIFETTIKREKGRSDVPSSPKLKEYRNEEEFLKSVKATLCYCGSFCSFGMAAAIIGPTLLELGCVSGRRVNAMSWVFFSQALSALFGSCVGGCLADRWAHFMIYLILSSKLNFWKYEKMNFRCSQDECMPRNCLLQLNRCLVEIRSFSYVLMFK